jgi:hypothetical protein
MEIRGGGGGAIVGVAEVEHQLKVLYLIRIWVEAAVYSMPCVSLNFTLSHSLCDFNLLGLSFEIVRRKVSIQVPSN